MIDRRFYHGYTVDVDGISFRVVDGVKFPGDLRIDWLTSDGWRAITMDVGFLLADFFTENEELRYPPADGYQGGNHYLTGCRRAFNHGWRAAVQYKDSEKRYRQESLFNGGGAA